MKKLREGVYTWSVFSDEKQLDFNGFYLVVGHERVLIDPPPLDGEQTDAVAQMGAPTLIALTNRHHGRAAGAAKERFGCPVAIHAADADHVEAPVDQRFHDGDVLVGALEVVNLAFQKSPGESGLYWRDRKVLVLGDALIGKPKGGLSRLLDAKYADPKRAEQGLQRLRELEVEALLLGDGASIPQGAGPILRDWLERHSGGAPPAPKKV